MKVLLDTNIIVDVALARQPYSENSEQVLSLVEQKRVEGYISASTFSDLYYIIRRGRGREWTLDFLKRLVTFCQIAPVNQTAIEVALSTDFRDLEDAVQYGTAVTNALDAIVTRNPQDFPVATPHILTPILLIQQLTSY